VAGAPWPPAILVRTRDEAFAAAAAAISLGVPLTLRSPPGAAGSLGIGWFAALAALVRERHPALRLRFVLDCGGEAGTAMAAFRYGFEAVRFAGPAADKLAAIALEMGAALDLDDRPALDLGDVMTEPELACRRWLSPG